MKNFLLFLISIVFALLFCESMVRAFYPQEMNGSNKVLSPMGYALNRSDGTIQCQQGTTRTVHYHFYFPGLRETKVNPNAAHILVLGDSVTFGWFLPARELFVTKLQEKLDQQFGKNKYQLLNAGSGGWGIAEYYAYLREFGELTHPKYVLIFLDSDDIGRSIKLDIFRLKNKNSLEITDHFHPFPHARIKNLLDQGAWYNFLLEHSALFELTRNVFVHMQASARANQAFMGAHPHVHQHWPVFHQPPQTPAQLKYAAAFGNAMLYQINQWCIQHHAKLLVVTTGYNALYEPNWRDPTQAFFMQAPQFFQSQHIAYHDIGPQFKKATRGVVFQLAGDGHPNAFGDRVIAESVWPWLEKSL